MVHEMKLQDGAFSLVCNGDKTVELRLNDEKRRKISTLDTIIFTNVVTGKKVEVKVVGLHPYPSFETLYAHFDKRCLGYLETEEANPSDMGKYYSLSEQEEYGVLGIEIRLV